MRATRPDLFLLCGLLLGGCGVRGTTVLAPEPVDIHSPEVAPGRSAALAAPSGWKPAPDLVTPRFPVPAARLFEAVGRVGAAQPRTFLQASYPERRQMFFVVRSALLNLPDLVLVQVTPEGPDASTLVMFSHSRYGPYEAGTNLRRLARWLRAVEAELAVRP